MPRTSGKSALPALRLYQRGSGGQAGRVSRYRTVFPDAYNASVRHLRVSAPDVRDRQRRARSESCRDLRRSRFLRRRRGSAFDKRQKTLLEPTKIQLTID